MLPQVFEEMSMQDLRTLVSERSMIYTHLGGEILEIPNNSIGFLLEGRVRTHGFQEELITSPAALLPPRRNQSFGNANGIHSIQNEEIDGIEGLNSIFFFLKK